MLLRPRDREKLGLINTKVARALVDVNNLNSDLLGIKEDLNYLLISRRAGKRLKP